MSEGLTPEQNRDAINQTGGQIAREVIAKLCETMLVNSVDSMNTYLEIDRETFAVYADSGSPAAPPVAVHVYPNGEEKVLHNLDTDQEMLEMILKPNETVPDQESRLRVLIPSPPDYVYPQPLEEPGVGKEWGGEDGDESDLALKKYLPREIFVEVVPDPKERKEPARYAISVSEVRRYDLTDGGDSVVEVAFSDDEINAFLASLRGERVSSNSLRTIVSIFVQFFNYDVAEERPINITIGPDPEEGPTGA